MRFDLSAEQYSTLRAIISIAHDATVYGLFNSSYNTLEASEIESILQSITDAASGE